MVVNGIDLVTAAPIADMFVHKIKGPHTSHGLAEVGYDIRLKQEVTFMPVSDINGYLKPTVHLVDGESGKGNFCLASAMEAFQMPNYLVGIVHDKSTWARHGLSVFNTVIEPGWRGFLTLELVYHGQKELIIPAGSGIAQVIFHKVTRHADYVGKYQDQADKPVEATFA
jgi:dCTP deaminase